MAGYPVRLIPIALVCLLSLSLGSCTLGGRQKDKDEPFPALLPPLPQDPQIQVYFNHTPTARYTEPYRHVTRRGDDLERVLVEAIAEARVSLDVAIQELRLPQVAQAIAARHRAGVRVRVILENTYNHSPATLSPTAVAQLDGRERRRYQEVLQLADENGDGQISAGELGNRDALTILRTAGVPLIDDTADGSRGSGLMHHKFLVIDGQQVVTGSTNYTTSGIHGDFLQPDSRGNANHLLVLDSPALAALFTEEFALMWGDGPGGDPDSQFGLQKSPWRPARQITVGSTQVAVIFSPISRGDPWETSTNGLIGHTLAQAQASVDLALFVFSDQRLADGLAPLHQAGVRVRALVDRDFAYRDYSEVLDLLGLELPSHRCRVEVDNRPWPTPVDTVGIPNLPRGDKLHHKFGIVDGQTIITGSQNWSANANHTNDEALLVIQDNPTVAAHFTQEFERLYGDAFLGLTKRLRQKISDRRRLCNLP